MKSEEGIKINITVRSPEEYAKKVLRDELKKHFKTVFVGSVFYLEEEFGSLWGEDKGVTEEEMTEEQKFWYEKFMKVREKIFDQGNRQRHVALSKFDYVIKMIEAYNART